MEGKEGKGGKKTIGGKWRRKTVVGVVWVGGMIESGYKWGKNRVEEMEEEE